MPDKAARTHPIRLSPKLTGCGSNGKEPALIISAPIDYCEAAGRRLSRFLFDARAASAAGIPYMLSTVSICPIEQVSRGADRELWSQLYVLKDRGYMRRALERARAAGMTLVFTADLPVLGLLPRPACGYVRTGGRRMAGLELKVSPLNYSSESASCR